MEHTLGSSIKVQRFDSKGSRDYSFMPSSSEIGEWCLALTLLNHVIVDALLLNSDRTHVRFRRQTKKETKRSRYTAAIYRGNEDEIIFPPDRLETILQLYLVCYRDGIGYLDHVDEVVYEVGGNPPYKQLGLTCLVPIAKPPFASWENENKG